MAIAIFKKLVTINAEMTYMKSASSADDAMAKSENLPRYLQCQGQPGKC